MAPTEDTPAALLAPYHDKQTDTVSISANQGSRFAKEVAGDHNPLHDADAPRFCVPGDLLFALVVGRYGVAEHMALTFRGMLRADTPLHFPDAATSSFSITDTAGRDYVSVEYGEPLSASAAAARGLIEAYVACSGQTFPDRLQPLLERSGVMFNPSRPLVVYDSMSLAFHAPPTEPPTLRLTESDLQVSGKRGDARFDFEILVGGRPIGQCSKKMVVSGLRPYDATAMDDVVSRYHASRAAEST